jgi:hypothetical protein
LATHKGVLCGVAVDTASRSCGSLDDCASEDLGTAIIKQNTAYPQRKFL